jgi:hypothetical protein
LASANARPVESNDNNKNNAMLLINFILPLHKNLC